MNSLFVAFGAPKPADRFPDEWLLARNALCFFFHSVSSNVSVERCSWIVGILGALPGWHALQCFPSEQPTGCLFASLPDFSG